MADTELKKQFIQLRSKGFSFDKIAKEMKKSKQTLINWSKDFQEEIANLKAVELESLQDELYLSTEARLKAQGAIYKKLKAEAESRDFADIPTDKLLDLLFKHEKRISDEHIEPKFNSEAEIATAKASALEWANF